MKKLNFICTVISIAILIGCGGKTNGDNHSAPTDSTKKSAADTTKVSNWNGIYKDEFGGTLTISKFNGSSGFNFQIYVVTNTASEDICTGEIIGKAVIVQANNANFDLKDNETECHLSFVFDGKNSIEVSETDCISMHGSQCGFAGTYKK